MAQVDPSIERDAAPEPNRNGLIYTAGRWWELVKDYWDILRPMRFCVLVLIAVSILIIFVPQSQDALLALFEDVFTGSLAGIANLAAFAALAFLWAFQTFYWARFVSRMPARKRRPIFYKPALLSAELIERRNVLIPRWLGGLVLGSVWVALLRANWPDIVHEITLSIMMAILGFLYLGLVIYRRDVAHRLKYCVPRLRRDLLDIRLNRPAKRCALGLAAATLVLFVGAMRGSW